LAKPSRWGSNPNQFTSNHCCSNVVIFVWSIFKVITKIVLCDLNRPPVWAFPARCHWAALDQTLRGSLVNQSELEAKQGESIRNWGKHCQSIRNWGEPEPVLRQLFVKNAE
jgi:hypothetical protein